MESIGTTLPSKLSIRGLSKSFGSLVALDNVSLDVNEGEFISVVGPSGCGKTTLLRIVAGLDAADAGQVVIDGSGVSRPGTDRGFVFQADCLMPWRTVWRNAIFGNEISGRNDRDAASRTRDLLRLVGLGGFEQYYPWQLSGGMRQRANLARALAINPKVLLMDEPFSALDAQTREIMQTELLRIWETGRKTVLFITHQIDEAVFLSDRVVVLGRRPGRIREIVQVDLPRPRPFSIKRTQAFVGFVDHIWGMIEKDVRASLTEELTAP
jgi:NitT/TauT family transport system ATP-binding protein